ncbi:AraC family transcriptional regulator [Vibrio cidicii]|nr:AraC family transcriptional regulator [Vibrio cidicii]
MNYAIEFKSEHHRHLFATARKRTLKHQLVIVRTGLALVKLGKQEFAVKPEQAFWIPQNCLTALTILPHTQLERCDLSLRLKESFPSSSGYVTLTPLMSALCDKLAVTPAHSAAQNELLAVLKREITELEPSSLPNPLNDAINHWEKASKALPNEVYLALLVREALKRQQSGVSKDAIVDALFAGNLAQCDQACEAIAGRIL